MDHIDSKLATDASDNKYLLSIRAALAVGKKTLNRYYNKTDHSEVFRIAMGMVFLYCVIVSHHPVVLHPHHKLQYFKDIGWQDDWIETARDIMRAEFERKYLSLEVQDVPTSQKVCLHLILFI